MDSRKKKQTSRRLERKTQAMQKRKDVCGGPRLTEKALCICEAHSCDLSCGYAHETFWNLSACHKQTVSQAKLVLF